MEFLLVFFVSLFALLLLVVVLFFTRVPTYRPSRRAILHLMKGVNLRSTSRQAWGVFLGSPIYHDEQLEYFRNLCFEFDEGLAEFGLPKTGANGYLYDAAGRAYIARLAAQLEELIRHDPVILEC